FNSRISRSISRVTIAAIFLRLHFFRDRTTSARIVRLACILAVQNSRGNRAHIDTRYRNLSLSSVWWVRFLNEREPTNFRFFSPDFGPYWWPRRPHCFLPKRPDTSRFEKA